MADNKNQVPNEDGKRTNFLGLSVRLAQQIEKTLPLIADSLEKTDFKETSRALISFAARSGYLNSAILHACETRNIYVAAILSRSMIEHNFRHLYIFVRALNESDEVGSRYYGVLRGNEDRQAIYNINKYNEKVYPGKTKWSLMNDHNKSIRDRANEFRIDEIFYYLVENNNRNLDLVSRYKKEYLLERLKQYTDLSSSVHGGPFGEATLLKAQNENPEVSLHKFTTESFELHRNLIETTYLFAYLMDENTKEYYEEIKKIISY